MPACGVMPDEMANAIQREGDQTYRDARDQVGRESAERVVTKRLNRGGQKIGLTKSCFGQGTLVRLLF
jgi:hypothetical protein